MLIALSSLLGVAAGPFLHHLAVAAGRDASLRPSASACHRCGRPRAMLVECESCGASRARVWSTIAVTGVVFGGMGAAVGARWVLAAFLVFAAMTVVLLITDIDHKRIPNRITYPGTPLAAVLLVLGAALDGALPNVPRALAGSVAYAGILLVVFVVARGGFGFGDVKLAIPLGLFVTYLGWDRLLVAGFSTALIGGLTAAGALVLGGAEAKSEIPYGPPMILGAWLAIVLGVWVGDWLL